MLAMPLTTLIDGLCCDDWEITMMIVDLVQEVSGCLGAITCTVSGTGFCNSQ